MQLPATTTPWYRQPTFLVGAGVVAGVAAVWLYQRHQRWLSESAPVQIDVVREAIEDTAVPEEATAAAEPKTKAPFLRAEAPPPVFKVPKTPKGKKRVHGRFLREKPRTKRVPTPKSLPSMFAPVTPASSSGVTVEDGRLVIKDWSTWMRFATRMMDVAVNAGAPSADAVLRVVLRTAVPDYRWPPQKGSHLWDQWERLVFVVADSLGLPPEDPNADEEATPRLRLVT